MVVMINMAVNNELKDMTEVMINIAVSNKLQGTTEVTKDHHVESLNLGKIEILKEIEIVIKTEGVRLHNHLQEMSKIDKSLEESNSSVLSVKSQAIRRENVGIILQMQIKLGMQVRESPQR